MNMKNIINLPLIRKHGLTIFSFVVGCILTYYFGVHYEKKTNLEYEIMSAIELFDMNQEISNFEIKVDSINIQKSKQNIRVISLKIINNGNKDISLDLYDNDNFGIKIINGKIIESPKVLNCKSDFLKEKLAKHTFVINDSIIQIPKLLFDKNDYYEIKFMVLHDQDIIPTLKSIGKISGQRDIEIIEQSNDAIKYPFWVQFCIGLTLVVLSSGIFGLISNVNYKYSSKKEKEKIKNNTLDFRNRVVEKYASQYELDETDKSIIDLYLNLEYSQNSFYLILLMLQNYIALPDEATEKYFLKEYEIEKDKIGKFLVDKENIEKLLKHNILIIQGNKLVLKDKDAYFKMSALLTFIAEMSKIEAQGIYVNC